MQPEANLPFVSICSITYNHAPFIRQCLDGFLMQQCNFPIELIINDDCSTDGTTEIIREYAEKYPDKIFPIFHEQNLNAKGTFQRFVFPKARGKYIALCEGDDYWTDPLKLQKQVDFLEAHPDYSMCFHKAKVIAENGRKYHDYFGSLEEREYFAEEIVNQWIIPTASIVFRSSVHVPTHKDFWTGDGVIHAACISSGRVYCLLEEMSVYRLHGNSWSAVNQNKMPVYSRLLPSILAYIEVFPSKIMRYRKRKAAFWFYYWLRNIRNKEARIPLRYFPKAIYLLNWHLIYVAGIILIKKILRMCGKKVENYDL